MADDSELLRRYAENRAEDAFAELVRRYLNLVYFAALRQVGGDTHSAEDVSQTVFTLLARRAASLTRHQSLVGWLHTTTRFTASEALRAERRRLAREQEAHTMHELSTDSSAHGDWEQLRPVIDDTLGELDDQDREAILLRFFANLPFAEVGAKLNLSENTARMRVDRALEKLRTLLAKRDITSTSAALAAVLVNQAAAEAPAGLAASVTGAALSGAAVAEAGAVAAVIAFMTATKTTVVLGIAAVLSIATAVYQSNQARATGAALATAGKDHAATRARLTDLEAKAKAAELALAGRKRAVAQSATAATVAAPKPPAAVVSAEPEAAKQQKALQQFLDNHPQFQALKKEATRLYWRKTHGPFLRGIGFSAEQIEQAVDLCIQAEQWQKAQRAAGLKPNPEELWARFRGAFGDAAAERFIAYDKIAWDEGQVLRGLSVDLWYTDEPFTAQQTKQLLDIVRNATTAGRPEHWRMRTDWNQVLTKAEPILTPVQLQGLRAEAASARMGWITRTLNKAANTAGLR